MCDPPAVPAVAPPSGTVTYLFTDVEGSTRLWESHPTEMQTALERHDEILRSVIEGSGGYVFSTAGDAFAALAWALQDVELASRLLTAVRRSPTPTQNFLLTIVYQQLRDEVGLMDHNPLDDNTVGEIYDAAVAWLSNC